MLNTVKLIGLANGQFFKLPDVDTIHWLRIQYDCESCTEAYYMCYVNEETNSVVEDYVGTPEKFQVIPIMEKVFVSDSDPRYS